MAAMMKNKGVVYAVENHTRRFTTLRQFAANSGSTIIQPINNDSLAIHDEDVPGVEYILLDPSCSGSGVIQQIQTRERTEYNDERIGRLSRLQLKLLCHAMKNFPSEQSRKIHPGSCETQCMLSFLEDRQALKILQKEHRLNPSLCKILVAELLFGAGKLKGESKPVQTVLSYEQKLRKIYERKTENIEEIPVVAGEQKQPRFIRINSLKVKPREILEYLSMEEGWRQLPAAASYDEYLEIVKNLKDEEFIEDFHVPDLYAFPCSSKSHWATHSLVKDCSVVLQHKSSCLAPLILAPTRKSRVLDMCSAPGLKNRVFLAVNHVSHRRSFFLIFLQDLASHSILFSMEDSGGVTDSPKKGPTLSTSTSSFEALDPHDPNLSRLATKMFQKTGDFISSELTGPLEDYKLLENMNRATISKYSDMQQITENLASSTAELNGKLEELIH
uniref:SAM-dependent MTase RsmB/NOP-type domain-containing protein n=1 Tax=Phlebotomus papatasi TaxID=29031 RepID=A0A1B0GP99_PHLPP